MVLFPHQQCYHFFYRYVNMLPRTNICFVRSHLARLPYEFFSRASYWLHYILHKFCISYQNKIRWDFCFHISCVSFHACLSDMLLLFCYFSFFIYSPLVENLSHFCFISIFPFYIRECLHIKLFFIYLYLLFKSDVSWKELWESQEFTCM